MLVIFSLIKNPIMNRFFILFLCLSFFISSTSTAQANNDDLCNALALEIGATCVEVTNLDNR